MNNSKPKLKDWKIVGYTNTFFEYTNDEYFNQCAFIESLHSDNSCYRKILKVLESNFERNKYDILEMSYWDLHLISLKDDRIIHDCKIEYMQNKKLKERLYVNYDNPQRLGYLSARLQGFVILFENKADYTYFKLLNGSE